MKHNYLTIEEILKLANKVPKWKASNEKTGFLHTETLMLGIGTEVFWEYEGEVDGLKVLMSKSASGSLFHYFLRIGVSDEGEFIGYTGKLKEREHKELFEFYNRVDQTYKSRQKAIMEDTRNKKIEKGLLEARVQLT